MNTKCIRVHTISHLERGNNYLCLFFPLNSVSNHLYHLPLTSPKSGSPNLQTLLLFFLILYPTVRYTVPLTFLFLIDQSHQLFFLQRVIYCISSPNGGKAGCETLPQSQDCRGKPWAHGPGSLTVPSEELWRKMSQDSRIFLYIPSLKKNSSRPIPGSAQDIIVQMKAPNRSPPLTRCLQIPGHFPPYTLSNVVLISCNHKKTNFRIFFFFQFPCLNNFVGTYRRLVGPSKVKTSRWKTGGFWSRRWPRTSVFTQAVHPLMPKETQDAWLAGV